MAYLIDGHNLIPKVPGLHLRMQDDEEQLILLLQDFAQRNRQGVDVFFDKAPLGHAGTRKRGSITAHFVQQGSTADNAMIAHLRKQKSPSSFTVVSSDNYVQTNARIAGASVQSSEDFTNILIKKTSPKKTPVKPEPSRTSSEEVDYWLDQFSKRRDSKS